jgi:hypothetical protein
LFLVSLSNAHIYDVDFASPQNSNGNQDDN